MNNCPACGHNFDADRCPFCIATSREVSKTSGKCWPIIAVSFVANVLINLAWPWLKWSTVAAALMLATVLVPLIINFVLVLPLRKNFLLRAKVSKFGYVASAGFAVLFTAFCLFNSTLDDNPSQEIPSIVVRKVGLFGKSDNGPYLVLSTSWNQERIEKTIQGDRHILSTVKPGDDAIHLIVHPGAFSVPWYDYTLRLK